MAGVARKTGEGGSSRPSALILVLALLVVLVVPVTGAGCGSPDKEVKDYLEIANPILSNVTASLALIRERWTKPLAQQLGIKDDLSAFRQALSEAQSELDKAHAPEPCRDLQTLLRKCLDKGRDTADIMTPLVDYLADVAPIAEDAQEIMDVLGEYESKNDIPSELATLTEDSRDLVHSFQTVICNSPFNDVHELLGSFLNDLHEKIAKAAKAAGALYDDDDDEEEYRDEGDTEERADREKAAVDRYLSGIDEEWQEVNTQILLLLEEIRMTTGITQHNNDFDGAVMEALTEIQRLESEYHTKDQ